MFFLGIKYESLSEPQSIKICDWGPWAGGSYSKDYSKCMGKLFNFQLLHCYTVGLDKDDVILIGIETEIIDHNRKNRTLVIKISKLHTNP